MPFTVRVLLHAATQNQYEALHNQMLGRGFNDWIAAGNGTRYQLLPAEYAFETAATTNQVIELAKQAAAATGTTYAVFVSETQNRIWWGLPIIRP
jgi:hypothetical protein